MYPILFRIGNFPINTYGVFLALAFLGAIFVTVRLAERDGLPREKIYDLCLWLLLSSLIGSKVLMFFTEPEYREHPLQLFSLDFLRSGGVFYGGLLGAIITGYFLMHRTGPRGHGRADRCEAASDATLRIVCNAHRLFLFTLVAQAKEIQRPGDS